jgi:hypothetical protein
LLAEHPIFFKEVIDWLLRFGVPSNEGAEADKHSPPQSIGGSLSLRVFTVYI